jgi:hypothetical protein
MTSSSWTDVTPQATQVHSGVWGASMTRCVCLCVKGGGAAVVAMLRAVCSQLHCGVWEAGVLTWEVRKGDAKGSAASSGSWVVWALSGVCILGVGSCGGHVTNLWTQSESDSVSMPTHMHVYVCVHSWCAGYVCGRGFPCQGLQLGCWVAWPSLALSLRLCMLCLLGDVASCDILVVS